MPKRTTVALILAAALASAAQAAGDATDPNTCKSLWSEIGLPDSAQANDEDNTIVCHEGYVLGHNNPNKTRDWVMERLTPDITKGQRDRPGTKFKDDPALRAKDISRGMPADYAGSGYAIGHQAPSADFTGAEALMKDTFFLSNAVPQVGIGFNTGVWSTLERHVKALARDRDELYVITGPVYQQRAAIRVTSKANACRNEIKLAPLDDKSICPERNSDGSTRCRAGVAVPAALYKIIYDPSNGGRANAYLLPNVDHIPLKQSEKVITYLKRYQVGIGTIEELTGYDFLSALPKRKQSQLKDSCGAMMLH